MKSNSKETNRIKEPSKFAIKFANTVFVLGILFSVITSVYAVCKIYNKPENLTSTFYYLGFLFAILTAILFVLGLRKLGDELKVNMSVLFVTVCILVYGFETYLEFFYEEPKSRKEIAEQMDVPFDTRTKIEVIEDLNDFGVKAYPNVFPFLFISTNDLVAKKGSIFPLGGISNITTVLCNESGYYPIVETDEHGFNNPKGLYEINKVDIVLTGDSFTEGFSVYSDETISAVLRKSGFNAISIGKGSNGSLIELAALKEYAEPLKPKIVLWVYYINDISDLGNEMESSLLRKYLNEDDFSQNLISRQGEIDSFLVDYVEEKWEREKIINHQIIEEKRERENIINHQIINAFKLFNLRTRINLTPELEPEPKSEPKPKPEPQPEPQPEPEQLDFFKDILEKSKKMVSGWGGKMYFVYLPEFRRYSTGEDHINREFVLRTANELEIPIIDIHREVFVHYTDPLSLFPFRQDAHYNADGYKLVAESISKRLKADRIIPLNLRK